MSDLILSARLPGLTASRVKGVPIAYWGTGLVVFSAATWAVGIRVGFQAALAMLVAVAFAAAIIGLSRPALGLLGIGMLCTLDVLMRAFLTPYSWLRWNTLNYWLLIVGVAGLPLVLRRSDLPMRLYQALLLVVVLGLAWSPTPWPGMLQTLCLFSLFGLLVYVQRGAHTPDIWYWLALLNGVLGAAGGAVFYLERASLPYINPNAFYHFPLAGILSICLAFHACRLRRRRLYLLGSLVAVNICWIFLSGSRGGLLVTTICVGYLICKLPGTTRRMEILAIFVLLTLAVLGPFDQLRNHTLSRLTKFFDPHATVRQRTSGRSNLAWGAWQIFLDAPLIGVGTGGFSETWARRSQEPGFATFRVGQAMLAHSAWLTILAENGLLGIATFGPLVGSFALVGWARRKRNMLALGALTTAVLGAAFVTTTFQGAGLWFLVASTMTLLHPPTTLTPCHVDH